MAAKTQCDRCKVILDAKAMAHFAIVNVKSLSAISGNREWSIKKHVGDLCPKCDDDLEAFMKEKPMESTLPRGVS